MNTIYRVVFNKIRGTLMVVNELTSSVQKKGSMLVMSLPLAMALTANAGYSVTATVDGSLIATGTVENASDRYAAQIFAPAGSQDLTIVKTDGLAIDIAAREDEVGQATAPSRVYGVFIGDQTLNGQTITLNVGEKGLTVNAFADDAIAQARGFRAAGGNVVVNGNTTITAQKVYNSKKSSSQVTAIDANEGGSLTFNGNVFAKAKLTGNLGGTWTNAIQIFGAEMSFNGAKTELTAVSDPYTAQTLILT